MKKVIHLTYSHTGVPQEYFKKIEALEQLLRSKEYEVRNSLGLDAMVPGPPSSDVIEIRLILCDFPSLRVGFEIGIACERKQFALAVCHEDEQWEARFMDHAKAGNHQFTFKLYKDLLTEVPLLVDKAFEHEEKKKAEH